MQIRNPADASAVEESFKRFFEVDAADRPREIKRLFVEVLDFADARGQVNLIGALPLSPCPNRRNALRSWTAYMSSTSI